MRLGKRTPQRIEYYLKYQASSIFGGNENDNKSTGKVNLNGKNSTIMPKQKENKVFEPKYNTITPFQRYLKDFYQEKINLRKNCFTSKYLNSLGNISSSRNSHKDLFGSLPSKNSTSNSNKPYSSRLKYIQEMFGDKYIKDNSSNSLSKSKSVFIHKPPSNQKQSNTTHNSTNSSYLKHNTILSYQPSNTISEIPSKSKIHIPKLNLTSINKRTITRVYNTDRQDQMKHMNPTGFNWLTSNTELTSKAHIYRSKNKEGNLSHRKPPNFNTVTSTHSVTKDYYEKVHKKIGDSERESDRYVYEMKGPKRFLEELGVTTIKKMFMQKGIHIYNFQNNTVLNNDDRITFQLRADLEDKELQNKLKRVRNDINAYGVDFKRVQVNTSRYPKVRKATPGKQLTNNKKNLKE